VHVRLIGGWKHKMNTLYHLYATGNLDKKLWENKIFILWCLNNKFIPA